MSKNKLKNYVSQNKGRVAEALTVAFIEEHGHYCRTHNGPGVDITFSQDGWPPFYSAEVKSLGTPGGKHNLSSGAKDVRPMDTVAFSGITVQETAKKVDWVIGVDVENKIVYPFSSEKLLYGLKTPCSQFKIDHGFGGRQSKRGKNPPLHPCEFPISEKLRLARAGTEDLNLENWTPKLFESE